ncbi:TPA: hypothetical protein ACGW7F_004459 [Bacillus cereus]
MINKRAIEIINDFIEEGDFFRLRGGVLARHFLNAYFSINIYDMNFKDIQKKCSEHFDCEIYEFPCEENTFYNYIFNNIMKIKREPLEEFNDESIKIIKDLKEIEELKNEYNRRKENTSDRYVRSQYIHLIQQLEEAKIEIHNFMIYEFKNYIYNKVKKTNRIEQIVSYKNIFAPYSFRSQRYRYNISIFSELGPKFFDLEVMVMREVEKWYHTDENKFREFVDYYVKKHKVRENILECISEHHALNARGSILSQAISLYDKQNFELFSQVIPLQIEGIIYDYCIELKINAEKIERLPLDKKIDEILKKDNGFYAQEYFKFKFIELRNMAAHGRISQINDYCYLAQMLLLDLNYICNFISKSETLIINKAKKLIEDFRDAVDTNEKNGIVFKYYANYSSEEIPNFYGFNDILENMYSYTMENAFMEYIDSELINRNMNEKRKKSIETVLKYLKNNGIQAENCTRLFKKLNQPKNTLKINIRDNI